MPLATSPQALVDGRRQDSLSLADRGFQYGDGLFETIAVLGGRPALWERHMQRLLLGCQRLLLPLPDTATLLDEALSLTAGQARAVLKLVYTAGVGGRGYPRPEPVKPSRILWCVSAPSYPAAHWRDGIDAGYCALRLMPQGVFAGVKHLGRLEQVLARRELDGRALTEGLMLDQAGRVVEGVASNVFAVFDNVLATPPITDCGIRGVMREHLVDLAAVLGIKVEERPLDPSMLDEADEIFLTNSLIGLWPIRLLEGRSYVRGPIGRYLLQTLIESGVCLAPSNV